MIYKGTDKDAFSRAGKGKTKLGRSLLYYKYKKENEQKKHINGSNDLLDGRKTTRVSWNKNRKENQSLAMRKNVINKPKKKKNKYVPKEYILDDIRNFRSSRIISYVSNQFATILMKLGRTKNMTNDQMNMLRSTIAFITSETINKALEKPLKIVDNIKMFIKVGEVVYKVILYFDEKSKKFMINEKKTKTIKINSRKYKSYLKHNHFIKTCQTNNSISSLLGKEVYVIVDKPIGSICHFNDDEIVYHINCGYLLNINSINEKRMDVYILGVSEPIKDFRGVVIAVVRRKNDLNEKLIACSYGSTYTKEQIREQISFQEKYSDIDILMN